MTFWQNLGNINGNLTKSTNVIDLFSPAIQFKKRPLLSYLAEKSAIWQQWLSKYFKSSYSFHLFEVRGGGSYS